MSYPDGCLRKNDRPKSLTLLRGESNEESKDDQNAKDKDKERDQGDNKRNKKDFLRKLMLHLLVRHQKKEIELLIKDHLILEKDQVPGKVKMIGKFYCNNSIDE